MEAQEAPQRLKIADRPHLARRWKQGAAELAQTANRLADLYRGLQIGEFTADALADVYATGGAEARRRYIEAAKEDAAKVRSHAIRSQIEQEAEQWRELTQHNRAKSTAPPNGKGNFQRTRPTQQGRGVTRRETPRKPRQPRLNHLNPLTTDATTGRRMTVNTPILPPSLYSLDRPQRTNLELTKN